MSPDTQCLGADNLDVTFFAEKLCQQPGITCPAHPNPLQQALGAAAAAGLVGGGLGGRGAYPARVTWGRPATLDRHFADHGSDFGARTADEYANMASDFFQRGIVKGLPIKIDPRTGVIRIYDPATNTFGAYNPSGTTRTFYRPDPAKHGYATNWDYWRVQPGYTP
jgi:hypothetical protein